MGQFESDVGNMVKFLYQNIKHITLICQHDKLHLVKAYLCPILLMLITLILVSVALNK